ncbi:MAG: AtpZ/AtpI family protein [Nitrospirota bacterium]
MAEKSLFRQLLHASTVGLNLVISTFVGLAIGYGLDYAMEKWFGLHTKPWLTIIFLILGIVSGFRDLFKMATKTENESDKKDI